MGKQNHTPDRRSLHESPPAQLQHPLEMQEKLLVLSHVLGSGATAHDRICPLWPAIIRAASQRNTRGLWKKKSCFAQNDCMNQWQNITHENTFWKLIFSSPSAAMAEDLALTVAKPQSTLLIFSMDSTASLPSSSSVGSLVARYRYMALSISSAKHPNIASTKIIKPSTQRRWAIPWTNLKILQHNQANSLACLASSTDFPFPKDVLQRNSP